jgi:hypothetical protein
MSRKPEQPKTPKTFDEAFETLAMTPEEAAALESETYKAAQPEPKKGTDKEQGSTLEEKAEEPGDANVVPDWVEFPPGFKIPPGKQIGFLRFRAKWTDSPEMGDRTCIVWPLSDADEKFALKRTRGESARTLAELSKQMIRAVDGKKTAWTGNPNDGVDVDKFWDQLGGKCRQLIQNHYLKLHSLSSEELADFFLNCVAIRSSAGG